MPPERRALAPTHTADGVLEAQTHPRLNQLAGTSLSQTRAPYTHDDEYEHVERPFRGQSRPPPPPPAFGNFAPPPLPPGTWDAPRPPGLPSDVPWPPPPPPPGWAPPQAQHAQELSRPHRHTDEPSRLRTTERRQAEPTPRAVSRSHGTTSRTPSQLEMQRIRSLRSGASSHFGGDRTMRSRSPAPFPEKSQRASQSQAAGRLRPRTPPTSKSARRTMTPPTSRRVPKLSELKGEMPDVQAAMRDGVPPRGARPPQHSIEGLQEDEARSAEEYLHGIQDLYHRMRQSYCDFRRNPEQFLHANESRHAFSPPKRTVEMDANSRSYVPLRLSTTTPAQPRESSESQKLREELTRLERQWERLDARRTESADDASDVPRTREGVLSRVDAVFHPR